MCSDGRPRKRDRRGDYDAAEYDGHYDSAERQDLEQEVSKLSSMVGLEAMTCFSIHIDARLCVFQRKMLLKDVTIQKEHRNTLQVLNPV